MRNAIVGAQVALCVGVCDKPKVGGDLHVLNRQAPEKWATTA